jgi:hypothetical protein
MRSVRFVVGVAAICAVAAIVITPERAEARCATFKASHNGTDLFNLDGGAKTAARKKLEYAAEQWQSKYKLKKLRYGKVSYRCDPWNMDYILPHHRCYAKARVCG